METINNIELRDENIHPDQKILESVLENSYKTYEQLINLFDSHDMTHEWRYYRDGKAWLCKIQLKNRTIVWMSAWKGFIKATMYFSQKLSDRIYELDISEESKKKIKSTKKVGKSTPCIFEIRDEKIFDDFEKVMKLKIECK